jgi:CheY-like chemotaxis protein
VGAKRRPRVAVIDDDPEFVALMEVLLEEEGYAYLPPPPAGSDLRAALASTRPDVAIVDLRGVSEDDGLGVIHALRDDALLVGLPLLVCSADLQLLRARAAQLAALDGVGILEKPFRIDALVGALERLLAGEAVAPRVGGPPDSRAVTDLAGSLARIGPTLRWDVLDAWVPDERPGQLRCVAAWAVSEQFEPFARLTRRTHLPFGAGLPGRIWVSGRAAWIADLASDMNFPRLATARRLGLVSAAAVPVSDEREIVGVLAGYAARRRRANQPALDRLRSAVDEHGPTFRAAAGTAPAG